MGRRPGVTAARLAGRRWVPYARGSVTSRLIDRHSADLRLDVGRPTAQRPGPADRVFIELCRAAARVL